MDDLGRFQLVSLGSLEQSTLSNPDSNLGVQNQCVKNSVPTHESFGERMQYSNGSYLIRLFIVYKIV